MFTCMYCLADTENDDDICDDCVKMANKDNCVLGHQCRENERDLVQAQSTIHGMNAEIKRLRAALKDARVSLEGWADYASDYIKEKWDLKGDLARIDAALEGK